MRAPQAALGKTAAREEGGIKQVRRLFFRRHSSSSVLPPRRVLDLWRGTGHQVAVYTLPLAPQETAHHGLGRREFHTSQGCSVLGSTIARPRGEINTPAGLRICVCVCKSESTHRRAHASVCTHSCVSSMTHIPIFPLQRKLVDPSMC